MPTSGSAVADAAVTMTAMSGYRLILASRSPRRARLLEEAGIAFEQVEPPFDDPPQPHVHGLDDARALAADLALSKAISALEALPAPSTAASPEPIVLGADTICVRDDGTLIGQPHDEADARTMIRQFAGRSHRVITGVALIGPTVRRRTLADVAVVRLGDLDEASLEAYLATGQWRGKAGGYNLFDRQADGWPIEVEGDPSTVVALPMQRLLPILAEFAVNSTGPRPGDGGSPGAACSASVRGARPDRPASQECPR